MSHLQACFVRTATGHRLVCLNDSSGNRNYEVPEFEVGVHVSQSEMQELGARVGARVSFWLVEDSWAKQ